MKVTKFTVKWGSNQKKNYWMKWQYFRVNIFVLKTPTSSRSESQNFEFVLRSKMALLENSILFFFE